MNKPNVLSITESTGKSFKTGWALMRFATWWLGGGWGWFLVFEEMLWWVSVVTIPIGWLVHSELTTVEMHAFMVSIQSLFCEGIVWALATRERPGSLMYSLEMGVQFFIRVTFKLATTMHTLVGMCFRMNIPNVCIQN